MDVGVDSEPHIELKAEAYYICNDFSHVGMSSVNVGLKVYRSYCNF